MAKRRVVVTGLGLISPVGNTVAEGWNNVRDGVSEVTPFVIADNKYVIAHPLMVSRELMKQAVDNEQLPTVDTIGDPVMAAMWEKTGSLDESKRMRALTDPHAPGNYRVNGVVSNMPEFRQAFGCREGQPMVRPNACRVW